MSKTVIEAKILSQDCIATDIYSMVIEAPSIACEARPGQFLSLYTSDSGKLLPRPISICDADAEAGSIRMVYRIAGEGTRLFSALTAGDTIRVAGPMGNGYTLLDKSAILIGGGIGIPPMLFLAKKLEAKKTIVLGFRDEEFLSDEFAPYGEIVKASDAGNIGFKGTVMDAIREAGVTGEVIYACGPTPMLKAIQTYAAEQGLLAYISLEERMACGIGACLACVCKTKEIDDHSKVNNTRICADGPVFNAGKVVL